LQADDVIAISGRREVLIELLGAKAEEVADTGLLDLPVASYDVFVTKRDWAGRTLGDLARDDSVRGVFLRKITRGAQEVPIGLRTEIERGDILELVGSEPAIERVSKNIGERIRPSDATDFVAVGLAIVIGSVLGIVIAFPAGGVKISLGTSVGTLLAGVVLGYIRSVRPIFGRVPDGAVSFMQSFGLAAFVGLVGIGAGPEFIVAIREAGIGLLFGGMVVTLVPLIGGLYFGKYVLKANPLLLLGGLAGAQTFTAGLAALQEKSGSSIAVIGYSGAVAVAHVLLTLWGTVIVLVMSR
jgi:putative transport protein